MIFRYVRCPNGCYNTNGNPQEVYYEDIVSTKSNVAVCTREMAICPKCKQKWYTLESESGNVSLYNGTKSIEATYVSTTALRSNEAIKENKPGPVLTNIMLEPNIGG